MAAIFDFQHAQAGNRIPSIQSIGVAWSRKHGCSRWNFVAIMCISGDLCNWIFKATILDFWLPLTYLQFPIIVIIPVECPRMNIRGGVAVKISFLASVEQEIYHARVQVCHSFYWQLSVLMTALYTLYKLRYTFVLRLFRYRPPSLIYHLPWHRTVFAQVQSCYPHIAWFMCLADQPMVRSYHLKNNAA